MSSEKLAVLKIDRSRRLRRVPPWVWAGLAVAAIAAFFLPSVMANWQTKEVGVAPVARISAATGKLLPPKGDLTAAGYVVADRQSVLAAKFTGRLARLNVAEADFVKKGTVVAEIDHSELDANILQAEAEVAVAAAEVQRLRKLVKQAEAEVEAAKAGLTTFDAENRQYEVLLADAKRRLAIDERLGMRKAVSESQIDDRRTEVRGAEAKIAWTQQRKFEAARRIAVSEAQADAAHGAVAAAEAKQQSAAAQVKVLESQREESFIRAPFDGKVTEKAAEVGEIVAPISIGGSMARGSIVTLVEWATRQAEVDVSESHLAEVSVGQKARIKVDAVSSPFEGKVRRILPRADRSKATVKVRVDFIVPNDPESIRKMDGVLPEMGVRVQFFPHDSSPSQRADARLVVPAAAVGKDKNGSYVWIVNNDEALRKSVRLGDKFGDKIEIADGLSEGDNVVVRGGDRLNGDRVGVKVEKRG